MNKRITCGRCGLVRLHTLACQLPSAPLQYPASHPQLPEGVFTSARITLLTTKAPIGPFIGPRASRDRSPASCIAHTVRRIQTQQLPHLDAARPRQLDGAVGETERKRPHACAKTSVARVEDAVAMHARPRQLTSWAVRRDRGCPSSP